MIVKVEMFLVSRPKTKASFAVHSFETSPFLTLSCDHFVGLNCKEQQTELVRGITYLYIGKYVVALK